MNSPVQTAKDLAEADRKRREEFKEQEMEKEFAEQEKLKRNMINCMRGFYLFASG